jgi:hypothetical protein
MLLVVYLALALAASLFGNCKHAAVSRRAHKEIGLPVPSISWSILSLVSFERPINADIIGGGIDATRAARAVLLRLAVVAGRIGEG